MILTKELVEEKTTMKFNETGAYIFKNRHPHQIGYYAVKKGEFDRLEQAVSGEILNESSITVYELDLFDNKMAIKQDTAGNWIPLGNRRLRDMEMLTIDEEGNVEL